MSFWELIIAYSNGGQWAPISYVPPPWLKPLVTPLGRGSLLGCWAKTCLIATPSQQPLSHHSSHLCSNIIYLQVESQTLQIAPSAACKSNTELQQVMWLHSGLHVGCVKRSESKIENCMPWFQQQFCSVYEK